nr:contractile injection system tape measure protein [Mucilaginibacter sp. JRF]
MAFSLRKHIEANFEADITSVLEGVFNQGISAGGYLVIDQLNVDIGTISVHDLEHRLPELMQQKLVKELAALFNDTGNYQHTPSWPDGGSTAFEIAADANKKSSDDIQYRSAGEQEMIALLYFLQYGVYPWWQKNELINDPRQVLGDSSAKHLETILSQVLTMIDAQAGQDAKNIIQRVFNYLTIGQQQQFIQLLVKERSLSSVDLDNLFQGQSTLSDLFDISLNEYYCRLFKYIWHHGNNANDQKFVYELIQHADIPHEEILNKAILLKVDENVFTAINNFPAAKYTALSDEKAATKPAADTIKHEGLYIINAGLILLHPFLSNYFKGVGLLNDANQFASVQHQQKATVLLYYLQCGDDEYNEWEMPFNKILCGVELTDTLPNDIKLTDDEKQEADSLLEAVAEHWSALKGASIGALRQTFLLRNGKLSFKDDNWLLQVERTGTDILLDRLPWGIGTAKLPWLKQIIYTEW